MAIVDESGNTVHLGAQLTTPGGEGSIYEIPSDPSLVAKVYHNPPHPQKSVKLEHLCRASNPALASVAAWPRTLIYAVNDRRNIRGFLMSRINGKEIHRLYGPRERQLEFPSAAWDFLIHVARNCAAAFETLHEHGVVMGDVNEKNLLVTATGLVRLIDCDSYQIENSQGHFLCDVGVPLWTPPELQSRVQQHGYHGLLRTPNHDRFGLAVLIFELLFMGRHPFAGVPVTNQDIEIHEAIRRYVFAFGPRASSHGVRAPPNTLPLGAIPERLVRLFEKAFLPGSEQPNARPTGRDWAKELDGLHVARKVCTYDAGHVFWNGLKACPWCAILGNGGPNFFISVSFEAASPRGGADASAYWAAIQRVLGGELMRRVVGDVSVPSALPRPMPFAKPMEPRLGKPQAPAAPILPAVTCPSLLLPPPPPLLKVPPPTPALPIGTAEQDARVGIVATVVCGCISLVALALGFTALAWVSGVLIGAFFLTWARARRPAQAQRLHRLEAQKQALENARRISETAYATEVALHGAMLDGLQTENAKRRAEAAAEDARERARVEREYRSELSLYSAQLSRYENAWAQYRTKQELWDAEVRLRSRALKESLGELSGCEDRLRKSVQVYQTRVRESIPSLEAAHLRFNTARAAADADIKALEAKKREAQLRQFLDSKLIINHNIDRIRSVDVQTLIGYGIESALDICLTMRKVPGIGDVRRRSLLNWKAQCERQFRFNPGTPLPQAEVLAVRLRYAQVKQSALVEMRGGADALARLEVGARRTISDLESKLPELARQYAQAFADHQICR